jgi:hypothetical protein
MSTKQRSALFWVFLALFTLIAGVSLLVALGFFPDADPTFRKVAIGTFVAGVGGDMLALFRAAFTKQEQFLITFDFRGKQPGEVELAQEATYELWDSEHGRPAAPQPLLVQQNDQGWWYCHLPGNVEVNERIRIIMKDKIGGTWEVPFFSITSTTKQAIPR